MELGSKNPKIWTLVSCHRCKVEFPKRIRLIGDNLRRGISVQYCSKQCFLWRARSTDGLSKRCTGCLKYKSIESDYHNGNLDFRGNMKLPPLCIECYNEQGRKIRRERTPEQRINDKAKNRTRIILKKYNLTDKEYQAKLKLQSGVCEICKKPESARNPRNNDIKPLSIDHDHLTGNVRGLLCTNCNSGIGKFSDDILLIGEAISYIDRYRRALA